MKHEKAQYNKRHNDDIYGTKMPFKANNQILNNKRLFFYSYIEQHLKFEHLTRGYNKEIFIINFHITSFFLYKNKFRKFKTIQSKKTGKLITIAF